MAMTLLPRFFVLESGGRYLRVTENLSGLLKFDEEQIWNPRVKFEVERAKTGDLVHIRSCYNNKYWEAIPDGTIRVICASGKKPEEDQSKVSCSLFEVHHGLRNTGALHLRFVQNGTYADRLLPDSLTLSDINSPSELNVINWETLVILPTHVSFRSEEPDGNYLCFKGAVQRFESGMDVNDRLLAYELFPSPNGNYRIKLMDSGSFFWRRHSDDLIWADDEGNNSSNDNLFSIVKISDNVIALRNLGNNIFCGGLKKDYTNFLSASYPTITRQARLVIEEPVLHREISDVRYRLLDSRISKEENQELEQAIVTNDSPNKESTLTLNYSISDSKTTHWTNTVTVSLGVKLTFKVSAIPCIVEDGIDLSIGVSNAFAWGESETTQLTRGASYVVVVPPSTSMKVTLMAIKGVSNVPFSYTQTDIRTTGERVITTKDDGVFTGINSYKFEFRSSVVPKDHVLPS